MQDINDVTAAMKSLSFSGGAFSQSIIKGYTVSTLVWMDEMTLQKYVELQVLVPFSTKALNFDPMPSISENGKTVKLWIHKCPKAAEFDPVVLQGVCLDQPRNEKNGPDFNSKTSQYEDAAEECKHQAGTGDIDELLLHLPFECDQKGFFDLVSSDPSKAIQLLTTKVLDLDNNEQMYPVCMFILSLEALVKPIVDVTIVGHKQCMSRLEMWKTACSIGKAKILVLLHLLLILQQDQWMKITHTSRIADKKNIMASIF